MKKKIIIGTAQFGMKYGVSVRRISSTNEQKKIIEYSLRNKNFYFDTSPYYIKKKNFFNILKNKNIKIIFKLNSNDFLNKMKKFKNDSDKFQKKFLNKYSKQIKIILIYNFEETSHKEKKLIYNFLKLLKKKKIIKKFGYSTYNLKKTKKLSKILKPDIIQCPFNIFDTRLNKDGYLKYFKKLNIQIHVRSIFLQGLLLMNKRKIHKSLRDKKMINRWFDWIEKNKDIDPAYICCKFVSSFKLIDRFVIGFHNLKQMKQIYKFEYNKKIKLPSFHTSDINLIHPGKWK